MSSPAKKAEAPNQGTSVNSEPDLLLIEIGRNSVNSCGLIVGNNEPDKGTVGLNGRSADLVVLCREIIVHLSKSAGAIVLELLGNSFSRGSIYSLANKDHISAYGSDRLIWIVLVLMCSNLIIALTYPKLEYSNYACFNGY